MFVSTSVLEIVDLGDGEIVLQRAEDGGEPLLTIRFSDEARMYILDQGLDVAKVMIQAGIQAAASIAEQTEVEIEAESGEESSSRVLH
ncbi:MAG: hypothetical protein Cons2KO_16700 [Congregibacter sp.]